MREQKRVRDATKKAAQDKITGGLVGAMQEGKANISNAFIDQILRDEDPFAYLNEEKKDESSQPKIELKLSCFVVDMEIPSIVRFILTGFKLFGIGKNLDV
jgi:hypothetical protein